VKSVEIGFCELRVANRQWVAGQLTSLFGCTPVAWAELATRLGDRRSVALRGGAVALVDTAGVPVAVQ
jgi:hypothetical protein